MIKQVTISVTDSDPEGWKAIHEILALAKEKRTKISTLFVEASIEYVNKLKQNRP